MNPKYCLGIILFALLNASGASFGAGPREPLTFKNVGQYGPWCEYLVSKDLPYDFLIVQAIVFPDHIEWNGWTKDDTTPWNEYLKRARANGTRVIADVHPALYTEEGELQTMNDSYRCKKPVPVERFFPLFDKFFKEVDEEELYAMTISEEHDSKSGQPQRLNAVYGYLKKNYKIDAYQWYTPSREGSIPGLNYPNLKADGWMADEYYLQQPAMKWPCGRTRSSRSRRFRSSGHLPTATRPPGRKGHSGSSTRCAGNTTSRWHSSAMRTE